VLDELLVELERELADAVRGLDGHVVLGAQRRPALAVVVVGEVGHPGRLPDEVEQRPAGERGAQVDRPAAVGHGRAAGGLPGGAAHQGLGEVHDVVVVRVGLVALEHRELGVVARGEPLVAEHPAISNTRGMPPATRRLRYSSGAMRRYRSVSQRVVVGDERLGERAAGDGVQDGGLDLDVAPLDELGAQRLEDLRADAEDGPRLGVDGQVDVALAVAGLGVLEAVPLVGQGLEGLADQRDLARLDAELAPAGADDLPGRRHPVARVEVGRRGPSPPPRGRRAGTSPGGRSSPSRRTRKTSLP
jgi:hypothetical protein